MSTPIGLGVATLGHALAMKDKQIAALRVTVLQLLAVKHVEKLTLCKCVVHENARAALREG